MLTGRELAAVCADPQVGGAPSGPGRNTWLKAAWQYTPAAAAATVSG